MRRTSAFAVSVEILSRSHRDAVRFAGYPDNDNGLVEVQGETRARVPRPTSASPSLKLCKISSVRACTASARDSWAAVGRYQRSESVSPGGPAPTIKTSMELSASPGTLGPPALCGSNQALSGSARTRANLSSPHDSIGADPAQAALFGEHWRDWPRKWVQRICKGAGVPKVSAHGMRGLHGTLAVDRGITSHAVASALGHESFKTTAAHYAKREAVAGAQQKRALAVLTGGRLAS